MLKKPETGFIPRMFPVIDNGGNDEGRIFSND
jgi:hypothetical protein